MNKHDKGYRQIQDKSEDDRAIDKYIYWICGVLIAAILLGLFNRAEACDLDCMNMRQFQFQVEQQYQQQLQQQQLQDLRNAQIQQQLDADRIRFNFERERHYAIPDRSQYRPH